VGQVAAVDLDTRHARVRAERIRHAARGWVDFWHGRVDLDALAWEVTELVGDIAAADARAARAAGRAARVWHDRWG
jgi:hypothetical protein